MKPIGLYMPKKVHFILVLSLLTLMTVFLNCTSSNSADIKSSNPTTLNSSLSDTDGGNGEPYGGKVGKSFFHLKPGFSCLNAQGVEVSTFNERIEIKGDFAVLTKNDCLQASTSLIPLRALTERDGMVQFQDKIYYDFLLDERVIIPNYLDPTYRWATSFCSSKNNALAPPSNYRYRFEMMTNYLQQTTVIITKELADGSGAFSKTEVSTNYLDNGSNKTWNNQEISISVVSELNRGEVSLIEDGVEKILDLDCSLANAR